MFEIYAACCVVSNKFTIVDKRIYKFKNIGGKKRQRKSKKYLRQMSYRDAQGAA
jgi:hypothetical protein